MSYFGDEVITDLNGLLNCMRSIKVSLNVRHQVDDVIDNKIEPEAFIT